MAADIPAVGQDEPAVQGVQDVLWTPANVPAKHCTGATALSEHSWPVGHSVHATAPPRE